METKEHIDYLISRHTDLMHGDTMTHEMNNIEYELIHTYGIKPDDFGFFSMGWTVGDYEISVVPVGDLFAWTAKHLPTNFTRFSAPLYRVLKDLITSHEAKKEETKKKIEKSVERMQTLLHWGSLDQRYKNIDPQPKEKKVTVLALPLLRPKPYANFDKNLKKMKNIMMRKSVAISRRSENNEWDTHK